MSADDPADRRAAEELIARAYRGPVFAAIRWRWDLDAADAEDLTQDFLATALAKEWLQRFDPERGRFRTFLRVAVDRFTANHFQALGRLKRGGGHRQVDVDDALVPGTDGDAEADARFRDEWVRSVFTLAVERLEREAIARGREAHLELFRLYDLSDLPDEERPTYRHLGEMHGLGASQVINHLAWARRRFRVHVLEVLRALAGSDQEFREDAMDLLGIAVS